ALDFPVSLGEYKFPSKAEEPMVLFLLRTPCKPGLPARDQHRAGCAELLQTPFSQFERNIRDQLARMLGGAGFDPARDIDGITVKPAEALGAGIDRLPYGAADKLFVEDTIKQILSAGWQAVTYRQNTELHVEAWHWNPQGAWSDPAGKGYFTGSATPGTELVRHSYGYALPHRGVTRDDGT